MGKFFHRRDIDALSMTATRSGWGSEAHQFDKVFGQCRMANGNENKKN